MQADICHSKTVGTLSKGFSTYLKDILYTARGKKPLMTSTSATTNWKAGFRRIGISIGLLTTDQLNESCFSKPIFNGEVFFFEASFYPGESFSADIKTTIVESDALNQIISPLFDHYSKAHVRRLHV